MVVVGWRKRWMRLCHELAQPRSRLRPYTPHTRLTGTGLGGVQIFVPVPVPLLTRCLYPHGFLYPCRSLRRTLHWQWFSAGMMSLSLQGVLEVRACWMSHEGRERQQR